MCKIWISLNPLKEHDDFVQSTLLQLLLVLKALLMQCLQKCKVLKEMRESKIMSFITARNQNFCAKLEINKKATPAGQ